MTVSPRPGWLPLLLSLIGAGAVSYGLLTSRSDAAPAWVLVTALASVALWVARTLLAQAGLARAALVCIVLSALAGALVAAPTNGIAVVPAAVGILAVLGDLAVPAWAGYALAVVVLVLTTAGAVPAGAGLPGTLAMLGGELLGVLGGLNRRQFRRAEERNALLREQERAMRDKEDRVALARDLHDVLAHSLGGLVVQLDAVDALLEAGDSSGARARVIDARRLAVDGLADAKRAVAALREPRDGRDGAAEVPAAELERALGELVAAHRSLGGAASFTTTGGSRPVAARQADALERALQEALSNARKHARGAPVEVHLDWEPGRVRLVVSNPVEAGHPLLGRTGGGRGLQGMAERFRALPGGGSATAALADGRFTVSAEASL